MLGLGQACRRKAGSNRQLACIGAKSLDRDLGDVHTWPHSHYLMRQCDGVGGWVQLKYRLCRCRCECEMCRCKINDLMKEKTGTSVIFISPNPLGSLTPIRLPYPLCSFFLPCLLRLSLPRNCPLCFPKIAGCLGPSSASEIASDAHLVAPAAELQSHLRIIVPGLTERGLVGKGYDATRSSLTRIAS